MCAYDLQSTDVGLFIISNQQKQIKVWADFQAFSILLVLILGNETLPEDSCPKSTSVAAALANRSEILKYLNTFYNHEHFVESLHAESWLFKMFLWWFTG